MQIMERYINKVAVVTGSSAGIGAAISKELVKHGVIVVGLARRTEKLQELANELAHDDQYKGKFYPLKCDLKNENEIKPSFEWIFNKLGPISILVNNAAVLETTLLTDATSENIDNTLDTNIKAVLLCTKEAVKNMTDNSIYGHIININSLSGQIIHSIQPNLGMLYSGSKHFLRVISEGLRRELSTKMSNIKVTNLSPGFVVTDLTNRSAKYVPEKYRNVKLEPKDIADACISVLNTPPNVLISELTVLPMHKWA